MGLKRMEASNKSRPNKIKRKLRYIGIIGSSFISVQCIIWIILCIWGICCFYEIGIYNSITFNAFKYIYLNPNGNRLTYTIISPIFFHIICWFYLIISVVWLLVSIQLIIVLYKWFNFYLIKKYLNIWLCMTIIVCGIDLLFSVLFLIDFHLILHDHVDSSVAPPFALKYANLYESMTAEKKENESILIENLKEEIKKEVKEYLSLKAQIKHHDEFLTKNTSNPYFFHNPFLKKSKNLRTIDFQERLFNVTYQNSSKSEYANKMKLEIPSAILMTLCIRGILLWIINLTMAICIICLYVY